MNPVLSGKKSVVGCIKFTLRRKSTAKQKAPNSKGKGGFSRLWSNKRAKVLLTIALIAIISVSTFLLMPREPQAVPQQSTTPVASTDGTPQPTNSSSQNDPLSGLQQILQGASQAITSVIAPTKPLGIIESAQTINSTLWRSIAQKAWQYFQPGTGVDVNTGLPWTGIASQYFTDWDLGVYIQATVDAARLGLVGDDGDWGVNARMDKVLTYLETRELNSNGYPYQFYQATDGKVWRESSDQSTQAVDVADTGRLLVALNNLRNYNYSLAGRINNIVLYGQQHGRSNFAALVPDINTESTTSTSIYSYYVAAGFAGFWPSELSAAPGRILDNILAAGNVVTQDGAIVPKAKITGDPLLCSFFELNGDPRLTKITDQVYSAHETHFNVTGKYRAFGEGAGFSTDWQWEWVVLPDGRTWTVLNGASQPTSDTPIIYTKIALGFLAIHNTDYTRSMAIYLERILPEPSQGFFEGADENGAGLSGVGSLTNGLILGAALYAINNYP